ncbi:MAG: mannose-1-phosphate guanylyltransferase [Candidatus Omnitrophota bacterium]|nr:mannose-1-phosphate guanylyltransferase [Candidatus Omnitrophota bacterium]
MSKSLKAPEAQSVKVYVVILVGGKGKRLRPLSTEGRPKAFLSVTKNRKTMFANTLDRARLLVGEDNIMVVANKAHQKLVSKDFRAIKKENLILEPVSRNTAPAIALAAHRLAGRRGDAIMIILPSDQYVTDSSKYLDSIEKGVGFVSDVRNGTIVLGIKPKTPSTQFGYILVTGDGVRGTGIRKVLEFTEKPDLETAKIYVRSGQYLWNAGAFIFKANTILKAIKRFAPKIYALLDKLDKNMKNYEDMPDISIDYAVMEKTRNIYCVKGTYGWNDIGSFDSLVSVLKRESRRFILNDGKVTAIL